MTIDNIILISDFKSLDFWIVVILNIFDSEDESKQIFWFITLTAIPRQISEAAKDSVVGFDNREGGSLVIAFFVERYVWEAVNRCSHE